jgi:hypothetical protein
MGRTMDARRLLQDWCLAFDNMQNRGLKNNWLGQIWSCIVCTSNLHPFLGVLLDGTGQIWFKDVNLRW